MFKSHEVLNGFQYACMANLNPGKNDLISQIYEILIFQKNKFILEKVRKRATRLISSMRGVGYDHSLKILYLTSIDLRRTETWNVHSKEKGIISSK